MRYKKRKIYVKRINVAFCRIIVIINGGKRLNHYNEDDFYLSFDC